MRWRPSWLGIGLTATTVLAAALVAWGLHALDAEPTRLPGTSFRGPRPPLDDDGRELREGLVEDVRALAQGIGERNTGRPGTLDRAAHHLSRRLTEVGLRPARQSYRVGSAEQINIYADAGRRAGHQLLVGAHYDSAIGSPGGNDNASGVAVVLALAERFARAPVNRWIRFALFVDEEPPHFRAATMGSRVFAAWAAAHGALPEQVIVLDSVGSYSDRSGSQRFPSPRLVRAFGDRGDFVAFIANDDSEELLMAFGGAFRRHATIRSEGAVFPASLAGVTWSDHASFWAHDVPAILVSDTAVFRDTRYHRWSDRGDQIDFDALVRVTEGLEAAIRELSAR